MARSGNMDPDRHQMRDIKRRLTRVEKQLGYAQDASKRQSATIKELQRLAAVLSQLDD